MRHRAGARTVAALRAEPERFFATVQVGITVVTTTAAAFGGARIARTPRAAAAAAAVRRRTTRDAVALAIVVVLISFLSLVLGELVPKSLALRARRALRAARRQAARGAVPDRAADRLAADRDLEPGAAAVLAIAPTSRESRISKEELEQMVDEAAKTGAIHEHASELASRALDFDRLALRDVMLPRARIDALPMHATMDQIRRFLLEERRSRIPVYDRSLDDILGYVSAKDIVSLAWDGGPVVLARSAAQREVLPRDACRPSRCCASCSASASASRSRVDEHGVVSGMVTFEDLVEELVGDIFSEHDEGGAAADARARRRRRSSRGDTPIRDVNRELGIELEEPPGVTTMAGPVHRAGGRDPQPQRPLGGGRRVGPGGARGVGPDGQARPRHAPRNQ